MPEHRTSRSPLKGRRPGALTAGLLVSLLALNACGSAGDAESGEETLVVSTFPFGVEEFQEAVVDPFTEETGIEVELDTGSNADRLSQLQLAGGEDPGVDVVLISDYYAALGQEEELFAELDLDQVPSVQEVADFATEEAYMGPAYSYQLYGTLYSTDELEAEEAASWDTWGEDALSGRVALPDISVTAGQLMVSGVAGHYGNGPYDVDVAFEQLGEWSPGVLQYYSSSTEVTNLLTQGEIAAAGSLNGFATNLMASGEPVAWVAPEDNRFMATNRAMLAEGAGNPEAAHRFIDHLLSVEGQTSSAEIVGDLPVNLDAEIPVELTEVVGEIADDPVQAGYATLDPSELVATRDDWVARFAREVSGQ
nr:extracellular solute-binding protein [Nesterenkonia sandarakina]